jgi:glycosyltransferase involved in cell wall biosynthesis
MASKQEHVLHAQWRALTERFAEPPSLELTILMPCLNEAETLAVCIGKARSFLDRAAIDGEIVVADNGSTDGSQELARSLGALVVHVADRGYGAALIAGIEAARGRFVIMGDSDDSYDFANLDDFLGRLRAGADLVMGNRFRGGIAERAMPPLHRYLGNPVLSFFGRLFFRAPVGDFHCGLRGFSRDAVLALRLSSPGMEFASEMVVKAAVAGLSIAEVPTRLSPDGRSRPSHLRSWRDGWRHLKLLLTFAPHWLFLYPGAVLAGLGALLTIALIPGPLRVGAIELDSATLIFAVAAILVGSQMVMFYGLAKLHATSEGLLPESPRFARFRAHISVDRLCLLGAALLGAGLLGTVTAVGIWATAGFGALDRALIVRIAALSTVALALGVQVVTTGFLWGLMQQRPRAAASGAAAPETAARASRPSSDADSAAA